MESAKDLEFMGSVEEVNERLVPVILGADHLAYSYLRSFDETYELKNKPIVLATQDVKVVSSSRFCDFRIIPGVDTDEVFLQKVANVGKELAQQGKRGLLLGSGDWYARIMSKAKAELGAWHYVPYNDFDLLDKLTQKDYFHRLCDKVGLGHPKTLELECAQDAPLWNGDMHGIGFPCIAKPSNSAAWHYAEFEGKQKIHEPQSYEELRALYQTLHDHTSYGKKLLVQDKIPGHDDNILSLTIYIDARGETALAVLGQVVLQDHTPLALGNPVCIVNAFDSPALSHMHEDLAFLVDRATQMLKEQGYRGYANFDIMFDPRDQSLNLLEVNTRPGRNTYYVSLAGTPFVKPIVDDVVLGVPCAQRKEPGEFFFTCIPRSVVKHYVGNAAVRDYVLNAYDTHRTVNPLEYKNDSVPHSMWAATMTANHIRKFKKWMPAH